jgi:spermidine synthase
MTEQAAAVSGEASAASSEPSLAAPRVLAAGACLASGLAALAFESLWFRQASLAFGSSVWASSLVLSGFMAGMAFGYALAERVAHRTRHALLLMAALELAIGASGVALVYMLPRLPPLLAGISAALEHQPAALQLVRFGCAFVLLLMPATAMGMTLPLLVRALRAADHRFGRLLGGLYGLNTAGAVLGTLLPQLSWLGWLGVRGSAFAAVGCNVLAAALALAARRFLAPARAPAPRATPAAHGGGRWLAASALAGFAMLGLEVVWLRFLVLFLNDTELAFAWMLAGVLTGIALGALLGSALARDDRAHARLAPLLAFATALLAVASYRAELLLMTRSFHLDQTALGLALPLTLPVAIASGWLFTALGSGLCEALGDAPAATSRNALANTLGGGLGSLLTGFWLLPQLGIERALFALSLVLALAGCLWLFDRRLSLLMRFAPATAAALALALFPFHGLYPVFVGASVGRWMRPGDELVSVREGALATFSHVVHKLHGAPLFDQLATNAYSMSVNDFAARRYMKQFVYLPRALHPRIENALVIGYGIGNTAAALVDDAELKHLDVIDVSPEGPALSREMHTRPGASPLDDERVQVHIEDGRHYLAGHTQRYDLITGEPPPPIIAGVVNLYTREFFQLMRERLADDGMVSYWLPMMNLSAPSTLAIIGGFCEAFPDCSLWHGSARNFMLLGTRSSDARKPVSAEHFARQWHDVRVAPELTAVGFELPGQLGATFIGDADYLRRLTAGQGPLTDDRPKRVSIPGSTEDRDALIWRFRDTAKARERFTHSQLIARLFPREIIDASAHQFENQRLLNDLLFPEKTPVRQTRVLHQVLHGTPLRLPVLLLLDSDPDVQRVLASLSSDELSRKEWQMHRVAGLLAARDFPGALRLLVAMPPASLPYEDLTEYVSFVVQRGQTSR